METRRRHPTGSTRLNAHATRSVAPSTWCRSIDDDLLATARRSTGLDDFGGETWRPHFDLLVDCARAPRRTSRSPVGSSRARSCCARCASGCCSPTRGRADPSILDEPIVAPVFVVGTGALGHVDPARAARARPREPGAADVGALPPRRGARTDAEAEAARGVGHAVHAFWADLQPAYETMHHNDGDEPNECIFATMLEFLSDQWGGTYDVPTYSAHLVGTDHTDAYRYHRKVLQTLQRRDARRALGAQGAEPPRASCARCSRCTPTRAWSRSTAIR